MNSTNANPSPDYVCVPLRMHKVASNWSLCDLDKVIWALERDNMLTIEELQKILPSKKLEEIEQLISLCLTNDESEFGRNLEREQLSSEENTIDIIKNSMRSVVPSKYSPGQAISSVLHNIVKNECFDDIANRYIPARLGGSRGVISPNYARVYEFVADLLKFENARPHVDESDAVVVLDMIFCLLQATDYLLKNDPSGEIEQVFSEVKNKISVLISSISASYYHRSAFLKRISISSIYEIESLVASFPQDAFTAASCRTNALPYTAPLLVVKEARLSHDVSHFLLLKKVLKNLLDETWQFPRSEANEDLKEVHKKLASFILNTLSLKATCVSSVNEYFTTLGMLMHHYEERVKSRVETPSSTTASSQSNAIRNTLMQSAAKLIASSQPCKNSMVRRVSVPMERCEIDKYINAVLITKSHAAPTKPKICPNINRSAEERRKVVPLRSSMNSIKTKKTSSHPPKLYRRID